MTKLLLTKTFLLLLSIFLGLLYIFFIHLHFDIPKKSTHGVNTFSFNVYASMEQNVKLHMAGKNFKLRSLECSGQKTTLPFKKMIWLEKPSEEVKVLLHRGENSCKVSFYKAQGKYLPTIEQKITYVDYVVLFVLLLLPLCYLLFVIFIGILDYIKSFQVSRTKSSHSTEVLDDLPCDNSLKYLRLLPYIVIALGMVIRIVYFEKFGVMTFQHDWHGHVEFIKYIAENYSLPLPSKGLEYPQQPLYYLLTGGLYSLFTHFGLNDKETLHILGYFSLLCSFVFLYYAYKFLAELKQSIFVQTVAMLFVSLTPSIVYISARINNDVLVMALSTFSLYYIVKSYRASFSKYFYTALLAVTLLFLSKISAAPFEILFFVLLLNVYLRKRKVKRELFVFATLGLFVLGFTLLRVYLPVEDTLHFVNSSSHYPKQSIKTMGLQYFASFNIATLIEAGQSYVFGVDAIRHSFLTYQYGTMLFGEFNYTWFVNKSPYLHVVMQSMSILALVFVLGFLSFILYIYKATFLEKMLFSTFVLNFLLILKFMTEYTVVCNTDFRYFVLSFVLLAFFFAKGLEPLHKMKFVRHVLHVWLVLLVVSEILFFAFLII